MHLNVESGTLLARLSGSLTIYDVAELQTQLTEAGSMDQPMIVDLGGVTDIDTAGLQWLIALRRSLGEQLALQNHSQTVIELLDLYQLAPFFGDVIVLSEHR